MWEQLKKELFIQGNFLLFFRDEWTVVKITQTGVKRQWIPEQSIPESELVHAMTWADGIFNENATMKRVRREDGSLKWAVNKRIAKPFRFYDTQEFGVSTIYHLKEQLMEAWHVTYVMSRNIIQKI